MESDSAGNSKFDRVFEHEAMPAVLSCQAELSELNLSGNGPSFLSISFFRPILFSLSEDGASFAFVPWRDVGRAVCHRNINKGVLPPIPSGSEWVSG